MHINNVFLFFYPCTEVSFYFFILALFSYPLFYYYYDISIAVDDIYDIPIDINGKYKCPIITDVKYEYAIATNDKYKYPIATNDKKQYPNKKYEPPVAV